MHSPNYSLGSKTAAFIGFKNFLRLFQDEVFLKSLAIHLKIRSDLCADQADFRFAGGVPAHPAQPPWLRSTVHCTTCRPWLAAAWPLPWCGNSCLPAKVCSTAYWPKWAEHHQLVRQPETGALPADFDVRAGSLALR